MPDKNIYVVHGDRTTAKTGNDNQEKNWDTVGYIAVEWLRQNPHQTQFHGTYFHKTQEVIDWIISYNKLGGNFGKDCLGHRHFYKGLIHIGQKLELPEGHRITNPPQAHNDCRLAPERPHIDITPLPDIPRTVTPEPEPVLPVPVPVIPKAPEYKPYYYAFQSANATNGHEWQPNSPNWAAELLAQSGIKPEFSKKYYHEQLAVRIPERGEKHTGDTGPFKRSGNWSGKDMLSREDDGEQRRDDGNGSNFFNRERTHVSVGGFIEKYKEDGTMVRYDKAEVTKYWNNNRAFTLSVPFKTWVIPTFPGGGKATSNPSDQTSLSTATGLGGLTQVTHAFADLNKIGKSAMFSDEQTGESNPFADPRRQVWAMMKDMTTNTINDKMDYIVANAGTPADPAKAAKPEDLSKAATEVLVALRDQSDNPLIKQNEPYKVQLEKATESMRNYYADLNIAVPSADDLKDLTRYPHQKLHFMDKELADHLHNHHQKDKYSMLKFDAQGHGLVHPLAQVVENETYGIEPNKYEVRIATAVPSDVVLNKKDMMAKSHEAWDAILHNPDATATTNVPAVNAYADFVATDFNAQMSAGALLHDMSRNPQNYGMSKQQADETVKTLLDGRKDAIEDVLEKGGSSPVIFVHDHPYALARPEVFGPALAEGIRKHPELFRKTMDVAINTDPAKTDGNRHPIGMLAAYGRVKATQGEEYGHETVPFLALKATLDPRAAALVDEAVFTTLQYGDNTAANISIQGREQLQNITAQQQRDVLAGDDADYKDLYKERFIAQDDSKAEGEQAAQRDQVGVVGIFNTHPIIARDAVFLTLMRHPEQFEGVKHRIDEYANSTIGGKNHQLRRTIEHVQEWAAKYNAPGISPQEKAHIWEKAAESYGLFFEKMEAKYERGEHHRSAKRKGDLYANAEEGMIDAIGRDAKLSATVMQVMQDDPRLMHAALKGTADATAFTDQVDHSHLSGDHLNVLTTNNDYSGSGLKNPDASLYFTLPRKGNGKIKRHGDLQVKPDPLVVAPNDLGISAVDEKDLIKLGKNLGVSLDIDGQMADSSDDADGHMLHVHGHHVAGQTVLDLPPEVQQQVSALTPILSQYMVGNDLHTNLLHILPPDVQKQLDATTDVHKQRELQVEALTGLLQREIKGPLPTLPGATQPISYKDLAQTMFDLNIANFQKENDQFGFTFNPQALTTTRHDEMEMGESRGVISKWMFLALIPLIKIPEGGNTIIVNVPGIPCPTCNDPFTAPVPGR